MATPSRLADRAKARQEAVRVIWLKILRGEELTESEQTAWSNRWCEDTPSRPWSSNPNLIDGDVAIRAQRLSNALG